MLVLNRHDTEALLDLDKLIDALEPAMVDLSAGTVSMPPRIAAMAPERGGLLGAMPVYVPSSGILASKLVTVYPKNARLGLPSHQAVVLMFDPETGTPIALMDGTYITAARTAACSALATRLLALEDAEVLVIVGTGTQARAHARAIPRIRRIAEIRVVGRDEGKARQLAAEMAGRLDSAVTPQKSLRDAMAGAGIVCATTHATEPVVRGESLKPGVHINSVGLNPGGRELDNDAIAKSLVVVESRAAALFPGPGGANDLVQPIREGVITRDHIHAELGEIIAGNRPGRTSPDQVTLYKSVGVAVQDAVAARLVLEAAEAQGVGIEIRV